MSPHLSILLAEDSRTMARIVRRYLETIEEVVAEVTHVTTLAEVLERMVEGRFDAVILDLTLEDSSALQTIEHLPQLVGDWPVLVLTESTDENMEAACFDSGASDFVRKSHLSPTVLRRALLNAVHTQRSVRLQQWERSSVGALSELGATSSSPALAPEVRAGLETTYREILDVFDAGDGPPPYRRFVKEAVRHGLGRWHVVSIHTSVVELRTQRLDHWFVLVGVLGRMADAYRDRASRAPNPAVR